MYWLFLNYPNNDPMGGFEVISIDKIKSYKSNQYSQWALGVLVEVEGPTVRAMTQIEGILSED